MLITAVIAQLMIATSRLSGIGDDGTGTLAGAERRHRDAEFLGVGAARRRPNASRRRLFVQPMRIGRDHIASTIYTIVFASPSQSRAGDLPH